MRHKRVYVNGQLLDEPYAHYMEEPPPVPQELEQSEREGLSGDPRENYGPVIVKQLTEDNLMPEWMESEVKDDSWVGRQKVVPIMIGRNRSVGSIPVGGRLPQAGRSVFADFQIPIIAYVSVICTMLVAAFTAFVVTGSGRILLGAGMFAISDLSVARERFVTKSRLNEAWGLPLYFAAQIVLAYSVV